MLVLDGEEGIITVEGLLHIAEEVNHGGITRILSQVEIFIVYYMSVAIIFLILFFTFIIYLIFLLIFA